MKVVWEQTELDEFIAQVRADENEACAVVADTEAAQNKVYLDLMHCNRFVRDQARHQYNAAIAIAAAIRARSCSLENENEQTPD